MYRFLFALVFVMGGFLFCSPTFAQEGGFVVVFLMSQTGYNTPNYSSSKVQRQGSC